MGGYFSVTEVGLTPLALNKLQASIMACSYLAVNNLNRDFIGTRGFSVVFRRETISQVEQHFPFFGSYLQLALQPDCNAFYLNPLVMTSGSRVDPHIDRSLRSYCKTVDPPAWVSVLYVQVPDPLVGGELILHSGSRRVGRIRPQANHLLTFQGDLTHAVNAVQSEGIRLSLVCEQYNLLPDELEQIPEFTIESRRIPAKKEPASSSRHKLQRR